MATNVQLEMKIKKIEDKLDQIIEVINEIENVQNGRPESGGTWYWKSGYVDENGNWIRGKFI